MRINSIRFKIGILYTAILGGILIIYSGILFFSLRLTLYEDLDSELRLKAQAIRETITGYVDILGKDQDSFLFAVNRAVSLQGSHPDEIKINHLERQWLEARDKLNLDGDYVDVIGPDKEIIVSAGDLRRSHFVFLSKQAMRLSERESFVSVKFEDRHLRLVNLLFPYDGKHYVIQVGTSQKPVIDMLSARLVLIATSIPLLLLVTSFFGRILTTKILKPVREITQTAKNITLEDLAARVKGGHIDEEMQYLVNAFNEMIARLEKSFKHIAEFSSQVAHELKTPLAIMRGEAELALSKERTPQEYKKALRGNLEEITRMLKTIEALLLLTKLEYRPSAFKFEEFEFGQFLNEVCDQARLLASSKNITVNGKIMFAQAIVKGDQIHLRRLFFNLIDNAVKFTPAVGKIDITASQKKGKIEVTISDSGVGIPEENISKIFDKFFHVDTTKANAQPGNGLGLSIARVIAESHSGSIKAESRPGEGSAFTVTLKAA